MEQPRVGFALTGSFCTLDKALLAMEETAAAYPNIVPILSETTGSTDTRFGRGADFRQAAEEICGHRAVESIREAEPIGPKQLLDVLDTLTPREEKVLRLRFGLDDGRQRTLEEVGKEFNVTRERIRQIEAKALRKLRNPVRSKRIRDFL